MGRLGVKYRIRKASVPIQTIVNEFEYGSTFSLYPDFKAVLPSGKGDLTWVKYDYDDSSSMLEVWFDDSFWIMDYFFEKFMTLCFYNLLDFGDIYLSEINLSESDLKDNISQNKRVISGFPLIGTMFKPYYHQTTEDKIAEARRFMALGCNVFKNDECFFLKKENLLAEAKAIHAAMGSDSYFVPNITAFLTDINLIESLIEEGISIFMTDYLISGFKPISQLKKYFPEITIWGHRIGYEAIKNHVSMDALCVIAQLAGIDWLHIGAPRPNEVAERLRMVDKQKAINPNFKPIFTIVTPQVLDYLLPAFGNDAVYLGCGYYRDDDGSVNWSKVKTWCDSFK